MRIKNFLLVAMLLASVTGAVAAQTSDSSPSFMIEETASDYVFHVSAAYASRPVYLYWSPVQADYFLDLGVLGGVNFNILAPVGFRLGVADGKGDLTVTTPKLAGLTDPITIFTQVVAFDYSVKSHGTPYYTFFFNTSPVVPLTLTRPGGN